MQTKSSGIQSGTFPVIPFTNVSTKAMAINVKGTVIVIA